MIEQPEPGSPSWYHPQLLGKSLISSCDPATLTPDEGEHIARWEPTRVLAEIDAKRRILELHRPVVADDVPDLAQCGFDAEVVPCDHARLLALAFADRDGYDESWRP